MVAHNFNPSTRGRGRQITRPAWKKVRPYLGEEGGGKEERI